MTYAADQFTHYQTLLVCFELLKVEQKILIGWLVGYPAMMFILHNPDDCLTLYFLKRPV